MENKTIKKSSRGAEAQRTRREEKVITQDECLAEALVPEDEQPYAVPGNWVWVRLGDVVFLSDEKFSDFSAKSEIKYIGLEHIEKDVGIISYGSANEVKSLKNKFSKGDIIYGKLRPYLNKHDITNFDGICSTDILVLKPSQIAKIKLVDYYLSSDRFIEYAVTNSKGINLPRVSPNVVLSFYFPLPPLAEQRRIVERIESLFEKLDCARELAQNALDSFETRKAAILHKAFTGELTAKWREENGVGMESWEEKRLQEVCESISCGGTPSGRIKNTGDIPFLKVYNIVQNRINFIDKPQFIDCDTHNKRLKKSQLCPNDVIMNIVGPPLRKIAIIPNDYSEWNMNQAIVRFRPLSCLNHRYLYLCLCYPKTLDNVISDTKGVVGQANISITQSKNLVILLPSLPEQKEIVRILDNLFEKEQRYRELCDIIDKIDLMKKAILARAFRGELGTNDPGEESAAGLVRGDEV